MENLTNVVLAGRLDFFTLGELIQLLGSNSSTGVVRITNQYAKEPGWFFFREGDAMDAKNGELTGLEAANSLFGWVGGTFEFSKQPVDIPNRIKRTRMQLVLEGHRLLDDGVIHEVGPISYERQSEDASAVLDRIPLVRGAQVDYSYLVEEEEFFDGDEILVEGLHGGWIWTILEGQVEIVKKTPRGQVKLLALAEGSFLGSIAAVAGDNIRSATTVAKGKVSLGVIDIQRLTGEFAKMSTNLKAVFFCLDKRLKEATAKAIDLYLGMKTDPRDEIGKRKRIIQQGIDNKKICAITQGSAVVARRGDGRILTLAHLGKGDFIGLPPFLDMGQEPGLAEVYVSEDIKLAPMDVDELQQEFNQTSVTVRNIADNLAACVDVTSNVAWELGGKTTRPAKQPAGKRSSPKSKSQIEKEKRRTPRFDSLNTVAYSCLNDNEDVISQSMGRTLNLSKKGILLHTFRPIDTCHRVRVHIGLKEDLVEVLGKVLHCQKDPKEGFHYGINFLDVNAESQVVLDKFARAFKAPLNV